MVGGGSGEESEAKTHAGGKVLSMGCLAANREAEVDEDPDVIVTREVELAEAVVRENLAV